MSYDPNKENARYMVEEIKKKLIGGRLTDAIISPDEDAFGFIVKVGTNEYPVWVDCDAEGNGPGWLSIAE